MRGEIGKLSGKKRAFLGGEAVELELAVENNF
jgi:hypothetical protein